MLVTVLGIKGKSGAVPRNVWVCFLFWGVRRTFAARTKKPTKRVCMGKTLVTVYGVRPTFDTPKYKLNNHF